MLQRLLLSGTVPCQPWVFKVLYYLVGYGRSNRYNYDYFESSISPGLHLSRGPVKLKDRMTRETSSNMRGQILHRSMEGEMQCREGSPGGWVYRELTISFRKMLYDGVTMMGG